MKFLGLIIALFVANVVSAQTVEKNYRKPLKEVLTQVENRFHVKLSFDEKLVADRSVNYAQWRFKDDVESTLQAVLGLLICFFRKAERALIRLRLFSITAGRLKMDKGIWIDCFHCIQNFRIGGNAKQNCSNVSFQHLGYLRFPKK